MNTWNSQVERKLTSPDTKELSENQVKFDCFFILEIFRNPTF